MHESPVVKSENVEKCAEESIMSSELGRMTVINPFCFLHRYFNVDT